MAIGIMGLKTNGLALYQRFKENTDCAQLAFDPSMEVREELEASDINMTDDLRDFIVQSDIIFLCMPSGKEVEMLCRKERGLIEGTMPGQMIIDLSVTPVQLTRDLAVQFEQANIVFVDAPFTDSVMDETSIISVGGKEDNLNKVRPYLSLLAGKINHCGPSGNGQAIRILSDLILFQTANAAAEAVAIAGKFDLDKSHLAEFLGTQSSAYKDTIQQTIATAVTGELPEQGTTVFSALQGTVYALQMADQTGLFVGGAENLCTLLSKAAEADLKETHLSVMSQMIGPRPEAQEAEAEAAEA